jgi:hypothetical protein
MEKTEEVWKKLDFLESGEFYSISNLGEVRNNKTDRIMKHNIHKNGYHLIGLCQNGKRKCYAIHRIIAQAFLENPQNLLTVDHIDRNKDNTTLENLRWASHSEQNINQSKRKNCTSQHIGVYWDKASAKWRAHISIEGTHKHLGYFENEEDAARAYDAACFSEFHIKNFA